MIRTHYFQTVILKAAARHFILSLISVFVLCARASAQTSVTPCADITMHTDSVIRCLESSLPSASSDTSLLVSTVCRLSAFYNKKSLYLKSEKKLISLLAILDPVRYKLLSGRIYHHLANTYKLSRDRALALQNYLRAMEIFEKEGSYPDLIRLYIDFAEYDRSIANFPEGMLQIRRALTVYTKNKMNDPAVLARLYNRYAAIENESTDTDSSLYHSLIALDLARKAGDKNLQAVSLNEIGYFFKNRRRVDTALNCYKNAVALWTETGSDADAVHGIFNQATLMSHNFFPKKEIIPYYEEIIRRVKKKQIDYPLDDVYFELSNCYIFLGDSLTCYKYRQKFFEELLDKRRKTYDAEVSNIREKYENEKYKEKISQVSDELTESEKSLAQKKKENLRIYIVLAIFALLLLAIGFLARKVNRSNKALLTKNKEKDALIQEIHHRVKNNLQFISSLINMQINTSQSDSEVYSLNDASRRIRAMALVHEMLYNQSEMNGIQIKLYLTELISTINDLINTKKIPIEFIAEIDDLNFSVNPAIALGMITSELIANSIKYAFAGTAHPQIRVSLVLDGAENKVLFRVQDNGKGLPVNFKDDKKLGMRLIDIFSRQIKGEYKFENDNGLKYVLVFSHS